MGTWRRIGGARIANAVRLTAVVALSVGGALGAVTALREAPQPAETHWTLVRVPPYLEYAVFDLVALPRDGTWVRPPRERERALAAWGRQETRWSADLTSLLVRKPQAGLWRFSGPSPDAQVHLRATRTLLRGRLVEPRSPVSAGRTRCRLEYRVTAGDEGLPPLSAKAALEVAARVTDPEGRRIELGLARMPDREPGVYESREFVACARAGRYRVDVTISSRQRDGQIQELYRDRFAEFTVNTRN